jgi:hypothetical protein
VLTHGSRTTGSEDVGNQRSTPLSTLGADVPWHEETPSAPARRKRVAPKTKRRNRKKGGWRTRKGLTWAQVKEVYEFAKLARQAGFPLNAFVTIKASWRCSSDQDREARYFAKDSSPWAGPGRGRAPRQNHFVGTTAYEKERNGVLHAHLLIHVEDFAFAKQWVDGDIIQVKRAKPYHLDYITKQRLPLRPDFEATCGHRRQPSEKIAGVRLSFSTDAKALIAAQRSQQSARVSRLPPRASLERHAASNSAQLAMRSGVPELARAGCSRPGPGKLALPVESAPRRLIGTAVLGKST